MWICENCGAENSALTAKCEECGDTNLEVLDRYLEDDTDF
jgi:ribosomal protein L40E